MSYDIDITKTPPAHEPERQYYYMAKAKDFVEKKSKEMMSTLISLYTTPVPYVRMLTTRCTADLDICRTTRKRILL